MNYKIIIETLMGLVLHSEEKSYDLVKDFQAMIDSPDLVGCVLNYFNEEMLKDLKRNHENPDMVRIELESGGFKIFKNNNLVTEEKIPEDILCLEIEIKKSLKNHTTLSNNIFSFKIDKNISDGLKKDYNNSLDSLITNIETSVFILEIEKEEMFNFKDLKRYNLVIPCFYRRYDNFYVAFFKDYEPLNSVDYSFDTMAYYILKRASDTEVDEKILKPFVHHTGQDKNVYDFTDNNDYILMRAMENVKYPEEFFKINFLKREYNNFLQSLNVLKSDRELTEIMEKYIETLSEDRKQNLATMFCRICMCEPERLEDSLCQSVKNTLYREGEGEPCMTFRSICNSKIKSKVGNSSIEEIRSFFVYAFESNHNLIMKYKDDFLKIMSHQILYTLNLLFLDFKERICFIIMRYNIRREGVKNKHCLRLLKGINKRLNKKVIKRISAYQVS